MTVKKNCLIVGYGSIGQRHAKILGDIGYRIFIVSRRNINNHKTYSDIKTAVLKEQPDYVVIANETAEHENALFQLKKVKYNNNILVEKPLFSFKAKEDFYFSSLFVGYNLRFHPLIQKLYELLENCRILNVQVYVGQYLPSWRPGTDYSKSYSASIELGGGVLRDLSHELDYLQFLFGEWKEMVASGGKFSDLNIESDDSFSLLYKTEKVSQVTLHMNYLDFITQRFMIINTDRGTFKADFINNTLQINEHIVNFNLSRNDTYISQHLAIINNEKKFLCSYGDGLKIVKMIEMAEHSSKEKVWVTNE